MPNVKIAGKASTSASDAIAVHANELYSVPGKAIVGIVELQHVERTQPAPGEDKEPVVTLRITSLEIANDQTETPLRDALRAMYEMRTAYGTLGEDGQVELTEEKVKRLGFDIAAVEASRLRVALEHWADYAARVLHTRDITLTELMHEFRHMLDGARKVLDKPLLSPPDSEGDGK